MEIEPIELPAGVVWESNAGGFPVLAIDHPLAKARVAVHGAHVLEWTPAGEHPVLYLSPRSHFRDGDPIRGGIPVCWPWFGAHPADSTLPAHGLARLRAWDLVRASSSPAGVTLRLEWNHSPASLALWPHPFALALVLQIGTDLDVRLTTTNPGEQPMVCGEALHTYLRVGDIGAARVEGLDGVDYLDTVGGRTMRRQVGSVEFDREVDRIFRHSGGCRLVDGAWQREIHVGQSGGSSLVVWNPWVEKSTRLSDLPPDGFHEFLCIESANCAGAEIIVPPGASHTLQTTVHVAR